MLRAAFSSRRLDIIMIFCTERQRGIAIVVNSPTRIWVNAREFKLMIMSS